MRYTELSIANVIAMKIIQLDIKAERYQKKWDIDQMNTEYAKAAVLKELVDDLGIDRTYFASVMEELQKEVPE